jgi:AraC family cel operon transcriptional repressor
MLLLDERENTDGDVGCFFHRAYSESEPCIMHTHEFYEVFLTDDAPFYHRINGETLVLMPHSVIFIRPSDVHTFMPKEDARFSFSNLAFSRDTAEKLFDFLGMGFPKEKLLSEKMPPVALLEEHRYQSLRDDFLKLNTIPPTEKGKRQYMMRELLYRMLRLFYDEDEMRFPAGFPAWLSDFCRKISSPESFMLSREELWRLSGKSYEYVSRSFRRYLGMTLGEYIWDTRLVYAANLLLHSFQSVTDICFASGFSNVSWFYTQFEKKFGVSPRAFRLQRKSEGRK